MGDQVANAQNSVPPGCWNYNKILSTRAPAESEAPPEIHISGSLSQIFQHVLRNHDLLLNIFRQTCVLNLGQERSEKIECEQKVQRVCHAQFLSIFKT